MENLLFFYLNELCFSRLFHYTTYVGFSKAHRAVLLIFLSEDVSVTLRPPSSVVEIICFSEPA